VPRSPSSRNKQRSEPAIPQKDVQGIVLSGDDKRALHQFLNEAVSHVEWALNKCDSSPQRIYLRRRLAEFQSFQRELED